jgi:hypothetical protein
MTSGPQLPRFGRRRRSNASLDLDLVLPVEIPPPRGVVADVVRGGEPLPLRDAIEMEHAVAHVERVPRHPLEALDERRREVRRIVRLIRRLEDDHVVMLGAGVPGEM